MRESMNESWVITLVSAFTFLFIAFLCLIIVFGKNIRIKNNVVSIVEKYNGINSTSKDIVSNYLKSTPYHSYSKCPEGYTGFDEVDESFHRYKWCAKVSHLNNRYRYEIVLFYDFNIPIFGNINTFQIKGQTIPLEGTPDSGMKINIE